MSLHPRGMENLPPPWNWFLGFPVSIAPVCVALLSQMQFWHSPCFALSRQIEKIEDPETSPDERSLAVITSPTLPLIK